jgi:hypothetical protein
VSDLSPESSKARQSDILCCLLHSDTRRTQARNLSGVSGILVGFEPTYPCRPALAVWFKERVLCRKTVVGRVSDRSPFTMSM